MDGQQLFRDANVEPTSALVSEGLGSANNAYLKFIDELRDRDIQVDWRYYNDGKAWLGKGLHKWSTARGAQKELTVCWVSIWEGFFKVSIFMPMKFREETLALELDCAVMRIVEEAKQMGKLKFFPLVFDIYSDELLDGFFELVDFRKARK